MRFGGGGVGEAGNSLESRNFKPSSLSDSLGVAQKKSVDTHFIAMRHQLGWQLDMTNVTTTLPDQYGRSLSMFCVGVTTSCDFYVQVTRARYFKFVVQCLWQSPVMAVRVRAEV